ncbi:MAG TPA: hypothetical protein VJZ26_17110 [Blastocatellia bacterium]|nr:hypothetical protein [Blastocatellia bacterium]
MTITANVKPLPAFASRISNRDIAHGEVVGAFVVWPAARPVIAIERGERLQVTLRIRPAKADSGSLKLAEACDTCKLRREENGDGYLLDITIEPSNDSSRLVMPAVLKINDGAAGELALELTANVQADNLTVTPGQIDLGEVSLAALPGALAAGGRVGIRKTVGSFRIKSLSTTLDFLSLEQRTIVEGSNYLIRVRLDQTKHPKAATYTGILKIETDDLQRPRIEVPIKLVLKQ